MKKIDKILSYIGEPYKIVTMDGEEVIYRSFGSFDFEVSGVSGRSNNFTLYVWDTTAVPIIVAVYSNIRGKEKLKDLLGFFATKYQNLTSEIQVEREE